MSNISEVNLKVICSLGVKLVEYFKLIRKYSQPGQKCIQDIQNVLTYTYYKRNTISNPEKIQEYKSTAFWKDSREDDFWNDSSAKVTNKTRSSIINPPDFLKNETHSSPKEIIQDNLRIVHANQMVPKNTLQISHSTNVLNRNSSNEILENLKLILQGFCRFW